MAQKKYTLPRHTNLANQGPRIGAFLVDLAVFVALTLLLLFACFRFVFAFKTKPLKQAITSERFATHLFIEGEKGKEKQYSADSDNKEFVDALAYFYTVYIPSQNVSGSEELNANWFNSNILKIEGDGGAYFEYVKVGEEVDKTQIGVIKEGVSSADVNKYLQNEWITANKTLNNLESFKKLNVELGFYNSLEVVPSALIASTITYILIPLIFKNGVTLGKKAFGLCLADIDGYVIENYQLVMRAVPLDVVTLAQLIPIWSTIIVSFAIIMVIFLVSFSLAMASPKKCSLHDFTGRTIVVNARTSILFDNVADEEEYIANEDNLVVKESGGEEPDLRYEK